MPRTLRQMCVSPTRFHVTGCAGCCGSKWKISITAPPGIRIQPILHVPSGASTPKKPRTRSDGASETPTSGQPNTSHQKRTARLKFETVMPLWLKDLAFTLLTPLAELGLEDVVGDSERL